MSTTETPEESSSFSSIPPSPQKPYLAAVKSASQAGAPPFVAPQLPTQFSVQAWKSMERRDTLSSIASHDRIETMSNLTSHLEIESVVSSWAEDDDYFLQSALQDIQVTTELHQHPCVPLGKGWKVANSSSGTAGKHRHGQRKPRQRQGYAPMSPSTTTASGPLTGGLAAATLSGGRFDALASEPKRRR